MPRLIKPYALPVGGTVAVVAPAGAVDCDRVAAGEARFRDAGFGVRHRADIGARDRFLAGDDRRRAEEFMEFVLDPDVDAVICARGGYGAQRMIAGLDVDAVRAARKPLVGYSDITTLLLWQRQQAGLVGFHAPMLERGGAWNEGEFEALVAALQGVGPLPTRRRGARGGPAGAGPVTGRLTGGSLTTLVASLGTPWEIRTRGSILMLEDVGERPYRLDRMLEQLRLAGKLEGVVGVGLGSFSDCDEPGGALCATDVLEAWLERVSLPWVSGLPFGHAPPNLPWPLGARAELDPAQATLEIAERGVIPR